MMVGLEGILEGQEDLRGNGKTLGIRWGIRETGWGVYQIPEGQWQLVILKDCGN